MKSRIAVVSLAALGSWIAASCSPAAPSRFNGNVTFSGKTQVHSSATAATGGAPEVCARFTLQPVSINAAGNETPEGAVVVINSAAASQTDAILGCIDSGTGTTNWGYQVTADQFVNCDGSGSIAGLSPAATFANATVQCTAGKDVSLNISVDVSIAVADNAGYVDISVGVDATSVQIGCKQADFAGGPTLLHFGESNIATDGSTLQGLVGIDNAGTVNQWAGMVNVGAALDTYYTGALDTSGSSPATGLIYQTFLSQCGTGEEYAAKEQPQCITTITPSGATTAGLLGDVFLSSANGFAAASITGPTTLQIYSDYAGAPVLMSAAPSPGTVGYNSGTALYTVPASSGQFTSIFVDQTAGGALIVTGTDNNGIPSYARLTFSTLPSPAWKLGSWSPLAALSSAQLACNGIFTHPDTACFTPTPCPCDLQDPNHLSLGCASAPLCNLNGGDQFFPPPPALPMAGPFTIASGLAGPSGLSLGCDGILYVTTYNDGGISRIDLNTSPPAVYPFVSGLSGPAGILVEPDGSVVVAERDAGDVLHIPVVNGVAGTPTVMLDGLSGPWGITREPTGNLLISNEFGSTIVRLTPGGTVTTALDNQNGPLVMKFDLQGNYYVDQYASNEGAEVDQYDPSLNFLQAFTGYDGPAGVALDSASNLYVSNYSGQNIIRTTPSGAVDVIASGLGGPQEMVFDVLGRLYLADFDDNAVVRIGQ